MSKKAEQATFDGKAVAARLASSAERQEDYQSQVSRLQQSLAGTRDALADSRAEVAALKGQLADAASRESALTPELASLQRELEEKNRALTEDQAAYAALEAQSRGLHDPRPVPLVVPEVNPQDIALYKKTGIIANLDEGEVPIEPVIVDVGQLLDDVAADARVVQPARPIIVDIPAPVDISADPDRLLQAVSILVTNALTHTPASAALSLGAETDGEAVIIRVADRGPGIPAEIRDRLFEPPRILGPCRKLEFERNNLQKPQKRFCRIPAQRAPERAAAQAPDSSPARRAPFKQINFLGVAWRLKDPLCVRSGAHSM